MPVYEYECPTHGKFDQFFKVFPSEAKQKAFACPDCSAVAPRIVSEVAVVGGALPTMEKITGPMSDASGRPFFRDQNGKIREVRSSKDIDAWQTQNALGKPRMVEYRNPVTGAKSWEPMRVGGLKSDPTTGEPIEDERAGAIVREPERLVPLDNSSGYVPPSESRTGVPLENGVMKRSPERIPVAGGILDPMTGKPVSIADCWGKEELPGK